MTSNSRRKMEAGAECGTLIDNCQDPDTAWIEIYSERIFSVACNEVRPQFNATTWACFEAAWIQQKPANQIAKELNVPIHSVYVNKSRVLKSLEEKVRYLAGDLPRSDSDLD